MRAYVHAESVINVTQQHRRSRIAAVNELAARIVQVSQERVCARRLGTRRHLNERHGDTDITAKSSTSFYTKRCHF